MEAQERCGLTRTKKCAKIWGDLSEQGAGKERVARKGEPEKEVLGEGTSERLAEDAMCVQPPFAQKGIIKNKMGAKMIEPRAYRNPGMVLTKQVYSGQ